MQVDARRDGALLLELYSRDGIGTMIRWGTRTPNNFAWPLRCTQPCWDSC